MPAYRLRGAVRAPDGVIGTPLIDEIITAADRREALCLVNAREPTPADDEVNALWLVDEAGNLVWSLRREDREG